MKTFDPTCREILEDPYPYLKHHREHEPVFFNTIINRWMVLKQKDMMALCRDERASSLSLASKRTPYFLKILIRPLLDGVTKSLLFLDNPDHKRLRSLVNKAFSPKFVNSLEPRIQEISNHLLNQVKKDKPFDLISEYAFPLPVIVISELLGVDPKERDLFKSWSQKITPIVVKPKVKIKDLYLANQAVKAMRKYFDLLFEKKRMSPGEDLISQLVKLEGDQLTNDELFSMTMLILIAGHETTTNQIGLGVFNLLKHPDQWQMLCQNPELIDMAVEEILRFDCSVQSITRTAKESFQFKNQIIKQGDAILLSIASCNRDPEIYENPDQFDITRPQSQSMSFGHGPHFCLGASLTRMELKIALLHLSKRFPQMNLAKQNFDWIPALSHRGLKKLILSS